MQILSWKKYKKHLLINKLLFNVIVSAEGSFVFGVATAWELPGAQNRTLYMMQNSGLPYSAAPTNFTYATAEYGVSEGCVTTTYRGIMVT